MVFSSFFVGVHSSLYTKHTCYICVKNSQFDLDGVFLAAENAVGRFVGTNC